MRAFSKVVCSTDIKSLWRCYTLLLCLNEITSKYQPEDGVHHLIEHDIDMGIYLIIKRADHIDEWLHVK